jgi:hypothetical protein
LGPVPVLTTDIGPVFAGSSASGYRMVPITQWAVLRPFVSLIGCGSMSISTPKSARHFRTAPPSDPNVSFPSCSPSPMMM